jgi:hypothetical protein
VQGLEKSPGGIIVEDLFAIPDYEAYFAGCFDPKFGVYCKGENTQLQFTFEAVDSCTDFPLGCKITYRAYSKDRVIEIFQEETPEFPGINLKPRCCEVNSFPAENVEKRIPSGMYILNSLPPSTRQIFPCPLVSNSKELLDEVLSDIKATFGKVNPDAVIAWEEWAAKVAPASNDVLLYIER